MALALLGLLYLALDGWSYYQLPWPSRFDAPAHRSLRPSGDVGHVYAYVGLGLILGNLLYLVRRQAAHVAWLGSMRAWMRWHVFSGVVGPGFVLLHSAFVMRTWPAMVSAISLAIVVASGLFGRYLYRLRPRRADGRPSSEQEVAGEVDHALIALRTRAPGGLEAASLVELRVEAALAIAGGWHGGGARAIAGTFGAMWHLRGLGAAARQVARRAGADAATARHIGRDARRIGSLVLRSDMLETVATAASSWRGLHRNLVIVMLLTASLHVSVAFYVGFGFR
jgi:hypothetical protein